jgi:hypothetical protein
VKLVRIVLGVVGGLLLAYGAGRLLLGLPLAILLVLGGWLLAAVVIHHGLLQPIVLAVGAGLRAVPERARGFVQAALIMVAGVTVIAIPLIIRQFSQPTSKAMLLQQYGGNLVLLVGIIALGTLIAYAIRVARDRKPSVER